MEAEPNRDDEAPPLIEPLLGHQSHHSLLRRYAPNSTSQVALIGAKVCPIESLDYEIIENDFFKHDWRRRGKIQILQYIFMKWTLCFLVGVLVGLVGFLINLAVENIAGLKFVVTSNMMLERKFGMAFGIFAVCNFGLTLFSSIVTAFIAPAAAGSGIPEVKAYLNGVDAPGIFSVRTLIIKVRFMMPWSFRACYHWQFLISIMGVGFLVFVTAILMTNTQHRGKSMLVDLD